MSKKKLSTMRGLITKLMNSQKTAEQENPSRITPPASRRERLKAKLLEKKSTGYSPSFYLS